MSTVPSGLRWGIATAMTLTLVSAPLDSQQPGTASRGAYEAVVDGMVCKQQQDGRMDCEYRIGRSLRFLVAGVGQDDVAISFLQVDSTGDYTATIVPLHGCVVVKPTRDAIRDSVASFAFVSPRNGKVYRNWPTCLSATRGDLRSGAKADAGADALKAPATKAPRDSTKPAPPARKPPV